MKKLLILVVLVTGCSSNSSTYYRSRNLGGSELILRHQKAVDILNTQLMQLKVAKDYPLIVSSVVSMNHLNQTSTFGRLVSEQISARFSQLNYHVVEPKLRGDLLIKEDGEFLITRELKEIAKSVSAQAVVVGTYVESNSDIYVNLKVVQPFTNHVLAAASYAVPNAKDIKEMLVH